MKDMRRIRFILLAFIVCASFQFAHPTHATMERDGATWWSGEELLDVYHEEEAERRAKCGEPPSSCFTDAYFEMVGQEPKYKAFDRIFPRILIITSINPAKETIKAFFIDKTISGLISGAKENVKLKRLYLGWIDGKEGNFIANMGFDRAARGLITGERVVYYGDEKLNGENWFPAGEEITLDVSGSNLVDNTSGLLGTMTDGPSANMVGEIDYSNCLKSPDYREGMECKLYSSNKKAATYFPYAEPASIRSSRELTEEPVERPSEQLIDGDRSSADELSTDDDSGPIGEQSTNDGYGQTDDQPISEASGQTIEQATNNNVAPKAPETGKTQAASKYDPGLMIWFISLMVIAVLLTIWWFIPTQAEKSRKKYKKSKKSIDKTRDLR